MRWSKGSDSVARLLSRLEFGQERQQHITRETSCVCFAPWPSAHAPGGARLVSLTLCEIVLDDTCGRRLTTTGPHVHDAMTPNYVCEFRSTLYRIPGKGGWVFAPVPERHAPTVSVAWGRTPVHAIVEGKAWATSVWREKSGRTVLAVPKNVRGEKDHADQVTVRLEYSIAYRA
jgi:hypothetical protein